jgi:hypothetical protein
MFTFIKDKNGWLSWERWTGFKNNVFCPFNKKMQCNANCPHFEYAMEENAVEFHCVGNHVVRFEDSQIKNKT